MCFYVVNLQGGLIVGFGIVEGLIYGKFIYEIYLKDLFCDIYGVCEIASILNMVIKIIYNYKF